MKRIAGLLLCLLLAGCAGSYNGGNSFVGVASNETAQQIAVDAVTYITGLYPPGHTAIDLAAPQDRNNFSQEFENGLRAKGFTLSGSEKDAVRVTYVLDSLSGRTSLYLKLIISDPVKGRMTVTRTYTAVGAPEAGFSALKTED
ncbi:MAG: hypothetical protein P4L42_13990 [Desulfocapsaceae bacterium]|nr:hypothetical protein [Desulfocapsaceae bacterium]